ncbi:MAG TPA: Maf family protein [Solirubrobacteraceae bacterium]|nr:Maf family protein [Solirubrobacteraceae bacterium]
MTRRPRVVLASGSPQRRAILELLGVDFVVSVSDVAELGVGDPETVARENAVRKARTVAGRLAGGPDASVRVLGVDTLVALGPTIYGKPADEAAARATLEALSGRTHVVVSGLALIGAGRPESTATVVTTVRIRRLDRALIDWYVAAGEWRGRAGGYAIQGRGIALVEGIDGDYSNVVGLPVGGLLELWPELLAS